MLISLLLISLVFSFCFQFLLIALYLSNKSEKYFRALLGTFIINTVLMVIISVVAVSNPADVYRINIKYVMWIVSGIILFFIILLKISIIMRIYRRSRDPEYYSINFFGKKVYEPGVVKPKELFAFVASFPFFLFIGAYFIARLINLILYGHI
ncbi:MAG TPA: hypothetical protein PK358_12160 [Spirochaetota bacterium]|nr:hypothetical protein [Spirochaetota bacterium]HPJ35584.1 hypothetical protein [Spirochaetota bacterium]